MTYADELAAVPSAFAAGAACGRALPAPPDRPLVAVGSGGSFSAARLIADIHQSTTGRLARAMTPQELLSSPPTKDATLVLCSASGRNADAVAVGNRLTRLGQSQVIVLTGDHDSPLRARATEADAAIGEFPLFDGEGFVATTSLSSFAGVAAGWWLSPDDTDGIIDRLEKAWWSLPAATWSTDTVIVMHGARTAAAAVDLESKFVEGRLGHIQISDHRNFTHGRFHWPMAHPSSTILVLAATDERELAARTTALIPADIPRARLDVPIAGPAGAVEALLGVVHLVAEVGDARGIDPGETPTTPWGKATHDDPGLDELIQN